MAALCAVTAAAEPDMDWPLYGNDHGNQRYSPLRQIDHTNVGQLRPAWSYATGKRATFQSSPIVSDGVLYLTTPFNDVIALEADTGAERWRYHHELRQDRFCCGPANRGPAVAHGKVYTTTIDARLLALDQQSGEKLWERTLAETAHPGESLEPVAEISELRGARRTGYTGPGANMAPQVVGDLVLAGITGAGYGLHLELDEDGKKVLSVSGAAGEKHGLRGFIAAFDAHDGEEQWRWFSVPEQNWEGNFSADTRYGMPLPRNIQAERAASGKHRDSWKRGGGSIWTTPAYDAERGLLFLGTGNPAPQMDDSTRPGDNLYTVSLVALEIASGRLRWYYQQVPHDRWGYDVASPPVLLDIEVEGAPVAAVAQASKLGWVFFHARDDGRLLRRSKPFVPQRMLFAAPTETGTRISPGTLGAVSWSPAAHHPGRQHIYVAGIHQTALFYQRKLQPTPEQPWPSVSFFRADPDAEQWGNVTAIHTRNGDIAWRKRTAQPMVGGLLATAGDLVFTGEGDGNFLALDAGSGATLWSHQAPYGVNAPPISYRVRGCQYIVVAAGGNRLFGYPTGDLLLAFALPNCRGQDAPDPSK